MLKGESRFTKIKCPNPFVDGPTFASLTFPKTYQMRQLSALLQEVGTNLQDHAAFRGRKTRFKILLSLLLAFVFFVMITCLFTLYLRK